MSRDWSFNVLHKCFTANFAKFLKPLFLQDTSDWLLLSSDNGDYDCELFLRTGIMVVRIRCCNIIRTSNQRSSVKKVFLKFRNILIFRIFCLQSFNFFGKRLEQRRFSVNTAQFLRTIILKNTYERLLLRYFLSVP